MTSAAAAPAGVAASTAPAAVVYSIPEIAAMPDHVNYRTAQKMLRSSNARMQTGLMLVAKYREFHDPTYTAPGSMSCVRPPPPTSLTPST